MVSHIAIFALALLFLSKGADFFVEYAGRIAKRLGVSDFIIGLTLTSVGTSIPELAASISASLNNAAGLVIGNVVGSNIANIGLIMGIAAIVKSFKTEQKMYERDGFIMIACVVLLFTFSLDNQITTWESAAMLAAYLFYLLFLIKSDKQSMGYRFQDFMKYVFDFEYMSPVKDKLLKVAIKKPVEERVAKEKKVIKKFQINVLKDSAIVLGSGIAIMLGAKYLIQEAIWLAQLLNVPESVIGISMIAVGTSLPELMVSISAVRKGKGEMVVGNVLGSNIANILLIVGVSGWITQMNVAEISVVYTIPIMLFFSLALLYFVKSDWAIKRSQGVIAVVAYVIFMVMAFVMGWS